MKSKSEKCSSILVSENSCMNLQYSVDGGIDRVINLPAVLLFIGINILVRKEKDFSLVSLLLLSLSHP